MNEYRNRITGAIVTESEFRKLHKNVSFPAVLDKNTMSVYGYDAILEGPQPSATHGKKLARSGVVQINGKWFKNYVIN